jgi:ABC-type Na+ efflux pump permease subunit
MRKPMLFFGSIGLISLFLGFLTGIVALYLRIFQHEGFRPVLYLVILLVLSGLSLFALGFLAEAIASLKEDMEYLRKK